METSILWTFSLAFWSLFISIYSISNENPQGFLSTDWMNHLCEELENQGITLPERCSYNSYSVLSVQKLEREESVIDLSVLWFTLVPILSMLWFTFLLYFIVGIFHVHVILSYSACYFAWKVPFVLILWSTR